MHNSNIKMSGISDLKYFLIFLKTCLRAMEYSGMQCVIFFCSMIILGGVEDCPVLRRTSYISSELFYMVSLKANVRGKEVVCCFSFASAGELTFPSFSIRPHYYRISPLLLLLFFFFLSQENIYFIYLFIYFTILFWFCHTLT